LSGHTPGPWTKKGTQIRKGDFYLASSRQSGLPPEEAAANAHLIASAPELLLELKSAIFQYEQLLKKTGGKDYCDTIEDARKVIAKAEGKS